MRKTYTMNRLLFVTVFLFSTLGILAQNGSIKGKVLDAKTKDVMYGAAVVVEGMPTKGVFVDFNGAFEIKDMKPGKYKVTAQMISYTSVTKEVTVVAGQAAKLDFSLGSGGIDIDAFQVVEKVEDEGENENMALLERKKISGVTEIVSAQEMSKNGDSRLNDVVKRSVGTTIEGGKYVYVRGLSDRYSKTTLNGGEIPGLDPDRNAVQIDLFPTMIVKQLKIVKSFSPDLPGDFTGGLVDIVTKDFPDTFMFSYSTSFTYNTRSSFRNDFLDYEGGKMDWLGFDDGTRDVPRTAKTVIPALFEDNEKLMEISRSFGKQMDATARNSFMNYSHSVSVGNTKKLFGKDFGFLAGLTYQNRLSHREEDAETGTYELLGNVADKDQLDLNRRLSDIKSSQSILWGALLSGTLLLNDSNRIGLNIMRNQNGITGATRQEGGIPEDQVGLFYVTNSLTYQERSLTSFQLKGEHIGRKLKVDWLGTLTNSEQKEPDLRYFNYDYTVNETTGDTLYEIQEALYTEPNRFYRQLFETNIDAKLHFTLPIGEDTEENKSKLKWGLSNLYKTRTLTETRFGYTTDATFNGDVTAFLDDSNMTVAGLLTAPASSIHIIDNTERRNTYSADQMVSSGYFMADINSGERLRAVAGVRAENAVINVASLDTTLDKGELKNLDFLPAINVTYTFKKAEERKNNYQTKLRMAYSRTIARPVFRELAPFATFDFATGWVKVGNPNLERTIIDNADIRLEQYFNPGEILAVSGFYKTFTNPIEVVFNPRAQNSEISWQNIDKATVYGVEFEFRKKLGFIDTSLTNLSVGANVTYVYSEVGIDSAELVAIRANDPNAAATRTMFGQSPYIFNAYIGYNSDTAGVDVRLSYNISGPKLAVVMVGATPNVFDQPRGQLDFTFSKRMSDRFSIRFRARNLLDPLYKMSHEFKGEEYIFNSYRKGRNFSIGFSYKVG